MESSTSSLLLGFMAFSFLFIAAIVIFWIWMLVDAFKRDFEYKLLWILVIFFTGIFGAIAYLFAVKRKYKNMPTSVNSSTQNPLPPSSISN